MKRYTILRITATLIEILGYLILLFGLLLSIMIFGFSYSILPQEYNFFSSAIFGIVVFVVWIFSFGHLLVIAQLIKVSLHAYDNTDIILQRTLTTPPNNSNEQPLIQSSANQAVTQWLKDNPGKGLNDYYSR